MHALEIVASILDVLCLYLVIFGYWRSGFDLLMVYVPFGGAVTLALNLWQPSLLFKDILLILPTYVGFAGELILRKHWLRGFPRSITYLMLCLFALAVLQTENPGVANKMMALIGLKVWLFYVPMAFVTYTYLDSRNKLQNLCRLLVLLSFVPVGISAVQLHLVNTIGYRAAMDASYGEVAAQTTQLFAAWQIEAGSLERIPSIFTFAAQFFGFCLSMLVPSYIVWRTDKSRGWRWIGCLSFLASAGASFISGVRAAFVFTPIIVMLTFALDRGLKGLVKGIGLSLLVAFVVLPGLLGIPIADMYRLVGQLFANYGRDLAYGGLLQALQAAPLGMGTGTNTGAARYAFNDPSAFVGIENYYAKALYELGLPGFVIIAGLFAAIIIVGFRVRAGARLAECRCWASALLAFFIVIFLNSFKGWLLDLDPVNVYYWVFCGLLLKLPVLQAKVTTGSQATNTLTRQAGRVSITSHMVRRLPRFAANTSVAS
jgi:hypothetical protein